MTFDDLKAKTYQLIEGQITLEDFSSWYRLAMAATPPDPEETRPAERKKGEFSDYYGKPYEPVDDDMLAHHLKMLGSGESE